MGRGALDPSRTPSCRAEPCCSAEGCPLRGSQPGSIVLPTAIQYCIAYSNRMWGLVSPRGKKHLRMLQEGVGHQASTEGAGDEPRQWVLCSLHASSGMAAPSRAPIEAQTSFSMQWLAPASWPGEVCWAQARTQRSAYPDSERLFSITHPSQACSFPVAAGLCCHHLLLCLLLTSWFNSKGLRMVKMIIQKIF